MKPKNLSRIAGGVWTPDSTIEIGVTLPAGMRSRLRSEDVDALLVVSAPGRDRDLWPRVRFCFGRTRKGVERDINPQVYGRGVRLVVPRGTRAIVLLPHTGAFFAIQVEAKIVQISQTPRKETQRLFIAAPGAEGGSGRLVVGSGNKSALTSVIGMGLEIDGRFAALSHDPQMEFVLQRPVGPGWLKICCTLSADRTVFPRVYLERDETYDVKNCAELLRVGTDRYEGFIRLSASASRLRFDPCDADGVIGKIYSLDIKPVRSPGLSVFRPKVLRAIWSKKLVGQTVRALTRANLGGNSFALPAQVMKKETAAHIDERDLYEQWISKHDFDLKRDGPTYTDQISKLEDQPLISVLMPVYKTPPKLLDAAIQSVIDQLYSNWELCIVDDYSQSPRLSAGLERWAQRDGRIKVLYAEENGGISKATNLAFSHSKGEWIALLDHDDVLRPHALAEVVLSIDEHTQLVYSDEDKIDEQGVRYDPFFKPDFSFHLLRGQNYFNHLTVHRAENIRAVGGWRPQFDGSQDYDLNLRIITHVNGEGVRHLPSILYHWRSLPGSAASAVDGKSYTFDAGMQALIDHIGQTEAGASVSRAPRTPFYRVSYALPETPPMVSMVIPTKDRVDLLRLSVGSILKKTAYASFEILIVDNQSTDPKTLTYFKEISRDPRVRVLTYNEPFNFSAINNFAVGHAKGDMVAMVNNDIEVINPDWLWEMVSLAAREEVGCVGAKLYYPDGTIQHAGVVIGIGSVAGHSHKYLPGDTLGYFGRISVVHEVSAVTAACLLVRKSIYEEVGGLNESDLTIAFNDVDFCLKVREQGYLNLMTPFAELFHHESVSRGEENSPEKIARFQKEIDYMLRQWRTDTETDPYYSVNLSETHEDYRLRL